MRQCVEHWVVEGWCGVVEEPMYDEHGNGGKLSNHYATTKQNSSDASKLPLGFSYMQLIPNGVIHEVALGV